MSRLPLTGAGPSVADAYTVYDEFTDSNGTTLPNHTPDIDEVGGGWVLSRWGQPCTIQSNKCDGGDWANHGGVCIDVGSSDFVIECTFRPKNGTYEGFIFNAAGTGIGDFAGWCIIYQPGSNRWWAADGYPGGGGEGTKGLYSQTLDETGATPYNIRITKVGNDVSFEVDDVELITWSSAKYNANTCVGFYGWTMDNTTFEDFKVTV